MPKFLNKLVDSMKLDDEYDEFEPDEDLDLDDYLEDNTSRSYKSSSSSYDSELDLDDDYDYEERSSVSKKLFNKPKKQQASNVVPMRKATGMEVVMLKPATINDAKEVADVLLSGRAVVINIEGVNLETAQRIVDFVSGACYSMNGNLSTISRYIFIVTPSNIELSGEFSSTFIGGSNSVNVNM